MNYASNCFPNYLILQIQRFWSNEEIKLETDGYFGGLDKSYYKRGIEMLKIVEQSVSS